MQYRAVRFGSAALAAGVIFQLTLGGIESIAHGDVNIFIGDAIHCQISARHGHVDVHVKLPPLMVMSPADGTFFIAPHLWVTQLRVSLRVQTGLAAFGS